MKVLAMTSSFVGFLAALVIGALVRYRLKALLGDCLRISRVESSGLLALFLEV